MVKLFDNGRFWVKILRVLPGQRTSLQRHYFRDELHIGRKIYLYRQLDIHRTYPGYWLELAWGFPYEDDIERVKDDYGRML